MTEPNYIQVAIARRRAGRRYGNAAPMIVGALLIVVGHSAPAAAQIKIATYNLLNYPGNTAAVRNPLFQTIIAAIDPDVIIAQELDSLAGANTFKTGVLDVIAPNQWAMATFDNGPDTDNALYYRTAAVTYAGLSEYAVVPTTPRQTDRWRLGLANYNAVASKFYVYSMHLKAGDQASDEAQRFAAAVLIRDNAESLPAGSNFVYAGDFNVQTSGDDSYVELTGMQADNAGRGLDPINMPGNWNNNAAFALIHTQSPHANNANAPPGAATGGVDDRFDFLLVSAALNDALGLSYLPGTYFTFANDGQHFNNDINDTPVIPQGAAVAAALHGAADHLPVVMSLRLPAKIAADGSLGFGTLITGGGANATLHVSNDAPAEVATGAEDLTYALAAPAGFTVPPGPFADAAAGGGNMHTVTFTAGPFGQINPSLTVNSNDLDTPAWPVALTATVLRHAVPSLTASPQTLSAPLSFGSHRAGEFSDAAASVFNTDLDSLQALLDVYDYTLDGPDAAIFSLPAFAPMSVGAAALPVAVAFDDSGIVPPRAYSAALHLHTRDQALPGATNLPDLVVNLSADVLPRKGDLNLDGVVDASDVPLFVIVLLGLDTDPQQVDLSDLNGDGAADGEDIFDFILAVS